MNPGVMKALMLAILLPLLLFSFSVFSLPRHRFDYSGDQTPIYTYSHFPKVKHLCAPVLPVLDELKPDDNRGYRIRTELKFENGEWSQEPDAVPLIPGDSKENERSHTKLVSFLVTDVDSLRRSDNMISVSGLLNISFGTRKVHIFFEGVYVESDENGGQRHMCLLATSWMPDSDTSFNHDDIYSLFPRDDQILLLLRYPKTFTLTTRSIYGEMTSLTAKSDFEQFGKVSISSQLGKHNSKYQFGSAEVLKACSLYKDPEKYDSAVLLGKDFCTYFQGISVHAEFNLSPNHTSFAQDNILGSFVLDNKQSRNLNFRDFRFIIRNSICHPGYRHFTTANVAAEFMIYSDHTLANVSDQRDRSGLFGKSIFVEGTWRYSERELCMAGCLGGNGKDLILCDYRVSLFFPSVLSIHRQSTVYGSITNINAQSESDATISFETAVSSPGQFLSRARIYTTYDYSKIHLARAFKSRHHLAYLVNLLRRTLFEYPNNLSFLQGDLTVRSTALAYSSEKFEFCECTAQSEVCKVLSVNLLVGPQSIHISALEENQEYSDIRSVVLSGYLSITGHCFSNVSLSVEGLYDPIIGTMHLMGCRDLRAFPVENTSSLEHGQDCMIEIEVEYPPTNFRWLLNQRLKILISSQREKRDPLYVSPIVIQTQPIAFPWQLPEEQFMMIHERHLMVILQLVMHYCARYQARYMSNAQGEASSSYVSLVMLRIQVLGYYISLIAGLDDLESNDFSKAVYTNSLILITFFLNTAYTFVHIRQVQASRTKPNSAREIKVLIITLSIHVLGLSIFLNHSTESLGILSTQLKQIETYWGLVIDLFLLPQIIANRLWQIKSRPLSKIYYLGFSLVRAFPHLQNYFKDPSLTSINRPSDLVRAFHHLQNYFKDPVYDPEYATTREDQAAPSLTSINRSSDLAIAITVFFLAFVVYIQQRQSSGPQPEPTAETESLEEKASSQSN